MPRPPQPWTQEELATEAAEARRLHRERRRREQLAKREIIVEREPVYRAFLTNLLDQTDDLTELRARPHVLEQRALLDMARYVALPFISLDDLDTMTESCFKNWVTQKTEKEKNVRPAAAEFAAAAEYLYREADPFRAPWLHQSRRATQEEREQFIHSTLAIRFTSIFQTKRRNEGAKRQEEAVRAVLEAAGYEKVKTQQNIQDPVSEMPPSSYTRSAASLRNTSIDIPIRLPENHPTGLRFVALEAKDTNTDINTRKRLMEVMNKSGVWNRAGFPFQFRTGAVLSGSIPLDRLAETQEAGVMIFWEHRLKDLADFLAG